MVKTWALAFIVFYVGCCSTVEAKKGMPVEKESPPSETEIICFAAMEKWVCAPASDEQEAKAKAMRLIEKKSNQDSVVIKTIPSEQQWQEAVIEEQISEEPIAEEQTAEETIVEEKAVANTAASESPVANNETLAPVEAQEAETVVAAVNDIQTNTQSQNFKDWQIDHPQQWTLQAVGTTNLSNLENFINLHQLGDDTMSIATTEVKGAPWHIVLVGLFQDRDQAVAYRDRAQTNGAEWASQAWPRPIKSVITID